jgi:hypothetical protein
MKIKIAAVVVCLFLLPFTAFAQCENAYQEALESYENGRPDLVEELLINSQCLDQLPKTRRIDALKLLVLVSISQDETQKAESYIKKLLELEPEYRLEKDDPIEFKNLFYSFRSDPFVSVGFSLSTNKTYLRNIKRSAVDNPATSQSSYSSNLPLVSGFSINIDLWLAQKWVLQTGLVGKIQTFNKTSYALGFAKTESQEALGIAELPLTLRYQLLEHRRNKLVAFLGGSYVFTNSSQLVATRSDVLDPTRRALTSSSINMIEKREMHNAAIQAGLGVQLKLKHGFLALNAGYQTYFFNHDKAEKKLSNTELLSEYFYLDDSFRLENLFFSFGYFYSFYKAKKLKYAK